ncbi:MAG: TIGR04283 family arsenosugar biosynthesis glycosyltransferase [Gammaproteobacteria bacterium]|nr:glycosyltransferase [Rhodocyclaceae bacterium]MBU3908610.1 TIGR04283 family arsenosugar biosynthesis glycosyltransferase [Gammaproteobacteria bacterium]MBU3990443.1 TIGR04283 family arsenosugar biosynthesis glycosyltransferase [Gammaproteobacteria bacterium]MBU4004638.1 TIGR04283 family arsenosugar biosynthesis glycosyltransferase [Gammaproteobacteria bacterium]MBU4021241.1 TIGR04283 family arsenosugar biosynthesis glycosyltransferase [Gammaproteobacteria bacterium]
MTSNLSIKLSIIVPMLNEAAGIVAALQALAPLRANGAEIIVVDGGSADHSVALATPFADQVVSSARGRASQMNAGAAIAHGTILLFLHADTRLPAEADKLVMQAIDAGRQWGRFDVRISGNSRWLPMVATMMNWRSRLSGIATGDQAMFVSREAFRAIGGFPEMPLMEDIALSRRLLDSGRPACLTAKVTTSGRRWEAQGVWRTILLMWRLRLRYFFGADPHQLAIEYGYATRKV